MTLFKKITHITNSTRHHGVIDKRRYWNKHAIKSLTTTLRNIAGRNNTGRVVSRTKGTRVRSRTRVIDHNKVLFHIPGLVLRLEYDPHRSSFISLVMYANGVCAYSVQAHGVSVGSRVVSYMDFYNVSFDGVSNHFNTGDSCNLQHTPQGTVMFDVERYPGSGGSVSRSAGTFCVLLKKFPNLRRCMMQLPSRDSLSFSFFCTGTKGVSSNDTHMSTSLGNAGRARRLGKKSVVRGVAQNPVDHAHGGGEGKKSKMCFPRTA